MIGLLSYAIAVGDFLLPLPQKYTRHCQLHVIKSMALGLLFFGSASSLQAEVSLSAHISSIGPGLELGYKFHPTFGMRAAWQQYSTNYTFKPEDQNGIRGDELTYEGNVDLKNASFFLDWYPNKAGFRFTTGFLVNNSGTELTSNCETNTSSLLPIAAECEIGSGTLLGSDIGELNVAIDFEDKIAPYLGIGWASPGHKTWSINADLGIAYLGKGRVDIQSSGSCNTSSSCRSRLDEEEREIEKDMESLEFFPLVKLGLGYRF